MCLLKMSPFNEKNMCKLADVLLPQRCTALLLLKPSLKVSRDQVWEIYNELVVWRIKQHEKKKSFKGKVHDFDIDLYEKKFFLFKLQRYERNIYHFFFIVIVEVKPA